MDFKLNACNHRRTILKIREANKKNKKVNKPLFTHTCARHTRKNKKNNNNNDPIYAFICFGFVRSMNRDGSAG